MKNPVSLHMSECEICPHRADADLCILEGVAAIEFETIRRTVEYQPGQFVFYEGHAALGLYVLCAGRVKLTRSTKRGQLRLLEQQKETGEEMAVVPLQSSHPCWLLRTKLAGAPIAQCLMRPALVIPVEPAANYRAGLCETLKLMLPDTFFLEAPEGAFTVSPCRRAASATDVSPFTMLKTNAARRLAGHRWMESGVSPAMSTSLVRYLTMSCG